MAAETLGISPIIIKIWRAEKRLILMPSNKFELLISRVINVRIPSGSKMRKNRKMIIREEKLKKGKKKRLVEVKK